MKITLTFFLLLIPLIIIIINPHPIAYLITLCSTPILIAFFSTQLVNSSWANLILIMIFSGGLLILFLFVISITPNQINLPLSILIWLIIPICTRKIRNSPKANKVEILFSWFYTHSWQVLIFSTIIILLIILIICEIIYLPVSTVKRRKE